MCSNSHNSSRGIHFTTVLSTLCYSDATSSFDGIFVGTSVVFPFYVFVWYFFNFSSIFVSVSFFIGTFVVFVDTVYCFEIENQYE